MITLEQLFALQRDLQLQMKPVGRDPAEIEDPEERIQFIKDMVYALEDELHELTDEIGWKPWATSLHINRDAAVSEAVDALHFLMNLFLVLRASADEVETVYKAKRQKNIDRQLAGYDGVEGKCPKCRRALDDEMVFCFAPSHTTKGYCSQSKEIYS